jgi:hypothetical protein
VAKGPRPPTPESVRALPRPARGIVAVAPSLDSHKASLARSVDGQPEVAGQRCNLKSNINLRLVQRCQVAIKDCVVVRWCPAMLHFTSLCQNTRHYCHTGCIMNARSSDSSYASTCACVGHTFLAINSSTTLSCGF